MGMPGSMTPSSIIDDPSPPRLAHRRSFSNPIDVRALARRRSDMLPALKRVKGEDRGTDTSWTATSRRLEEMRARQANGASPLARQGAGPPALHARHRRTSSDSVLLAEAAASLKRERREGEGAHAGGTPHDLVRLVPGADALQSVAERFVHKAEHRGPSRLWASCGAAHAG